MLPGEISTVIGQKKSTHDFEHPIRVLISAKHSKAPLKLSPVAILIKPVRS